MGGRTSPRELGVKSGGKIEDPNLSIFQEITKRLKKRGSQRKAYMVKDNRHPNKEIKKSNASWLK